MGVLPTGQRTQKSSDRRDAKRRRSSSQKRPINPFLNFLSRFTHHAIVGGIVISWGMLGGIDRLAGFVPGLHAKHASTQAIADTPQDAVWIVDANGDGVGDYANPTHNLIRGVDAYGSGQFGAERDGGKRKHHGVDYVATPGDWVEAPIAGVVTKYGYAYRKDSELRYVEIKNAETGMIAKVLYVDATVADGSTVAAGEIIGTAQDLAERYPGGITNHVHVELINRQGAILDPATLLPLGDQHFAAGGAPITINLRSPS
jgi:murein DD-endopeptidase MepM/ murein hydrolase activator NlpD